MDRSSAAIEGVSKGFTGHGGTAFALALLVACVPIIGCASAPGQRASGEDAVETPVPAEGAMSRADVPVGETAGPQTERPPRSPVERREADREWSHAPSGMRFPVEVAGFQRDGMTTYHDSGDDMSVGYHRLDDATAMMATVYIYPTWRYGAQIDQQFEDAKAAVLRHRDGAELLADGPMRIFQRGEFRTGRRAHFLVRDPKGKRPLIVSHLFLFEHGPWFIKYRATFPAEQHEACDEALLEFMAALIWPDVQPGRLAQR